MYLQGEKQQLDHTLSTVVGSHLTNNCKTFENSNFDFYNQITILLGPF